MRTSPLPVVAIAALLVLGGCASLPGANDGGPSPDEFPDASAIDQSVYDRHAALLANTSFTVRFETTEERLDPRGTGNITWMNSSERVLVEPGASQYLSQPNGTIDYLGATTIQGVYSNGSSDRVYLLKREDGESTVEAGTSRVFNESGDYYLWQGWREFSRLSLYSLISENVTFERRGIETFDGVDVMRYEARGADAMPALFREADNTTFTDFSVTLLLDENGVIRYYRAELDATRDWEGISDWEKLYNRTLVSTVTDVGSTDVGKPDWVSNATAGS